jgi:parvulin-like peptidyl-prolyl isomerase
MNVRQLRTILLAPLICTLGALAAAEQPIMPLDTVLASNARTKVTYQDFLAEIARIPERDQMEFLMNRLRLATVVENILVNKTLAYEGRQNKLHLKPNIQAEIENQTDKILARYRGQEIQAQAKVPDLTPLAVETYKANPQQFEIPEYYDSWHVLVSLRGRTKEDAQKRAAVIREMVVKGIPQDDLAREYSDDPGVRNNRGRLKGFPLAHFDPAYANALKALKIGEISQPVETQHGFHIIQLMAFTPKRTMPFEEVKDRLIAVAKEKYVDSAWATHIESIRGAKDVTVNVEAMDKIRPKIPEGLITPSAADSK